MQRRPRQALQLRLADGYAVVGGKRRRREQDEEGLRREEVDVGPRDGEPLRGGLPHHISGDKGRRRW
jgi:hypothetical protein